MESSEDRWLDFLKDPTVRAYVSKQTKAAGLVFYRVTTHAVYFIKAIQMEIDKAVSKIVVLVGLGKAFPLSSPQLHFATSFSKPSLKDYRDILVELIGQNWTWEVTLVQIMDKLPKFLSKLLGMRGQGSSMQRLGEFHADRLYDYSILKELSQHNPFICFENAEEQVTMFVVSITSTHVLFFQPLAQPCFNQENKLIIPREAELKAMRLVFWAQIQSLTEISHFRSNKNEYSLQFTAFRLQKMQYTKRVWRKTLNITRSAQFIECLIKEASHFGVQVSVEVGSVKANSAEEGLLVEAKRKQQKLKHYFNVESLMELIDSYQRLVEYYSADGPPYQEIYVHKTTTLYNRPDVQLIMHATNSR